MDGWKEDGQTKWIVQGNEKSFNKKERKTNERFKIIRTNIKNNIFLPKDLGKNY